MGSNSRDFQVDIESTLKTEQHASMNIKMRNVKVGLTASSSLLPTEENL